VIRSTDNLDKEIPGDQPFTTRAWKCGKRQLPTTSPRHGLVGDKPVTTESLDR